MNKNNIKFTLSENIILMATQYANKNWKVFIEDKSTDQKKIVDKSVNGEELKFLLNHAIKLVSKKKTPIDMNLSILKDIFQFIINNKKHEKEKQKEKE